MLELVLTIGQQNIINELNKYGAVHCTHLMRHSQWQELVEACYCYRDGDFYRAHETYTTPDFQMCEPDARGTTTQAADQQFEDTRWHLFMDGKLQL